MIVFDTLLLSYVFSEQYQKKPLAARQDVFAHNKLYTGGHNPTTGRAKVHGRTDWAAK